MWMSTWLSCVGLLFFFFFWGLHFVWMLAVPFLSVYRQLSPWEGCEVSQLAFFQGGGVVAVTGHQALGSGSVPREVEVIGPECWSHLDSFFSLTNFLSFFFPFVLPSYVEVFLSSFEVWSFLQAFSRCSVWIIIHIDLAVGGEFFGRRLAPCATTLLSWSSLSIFTMLFKPFW